MKKKNYTPIALGEVEDGSEKWLAWREHGPHFDDPLHPDFIPVAIGGSAVAAIFGDSPWKSRLELYHEKSGAVEPKYKRPKNQEILDAGHMYEDLVARTFVRKMHKEGVENIEMWNDTNMYQHPLYKFALCNVDRRIKVNGVPGILECKTTGNFEDIKLWKEGICPKKYEWQCRYYMATLNVDFCYITCCWGFTLDECAIVLIERDLDIEEKMMKEVEDFVDHCIDGIEPDMQTSHMKELASYYVRLYGEIEPSAPAVELPDTEEVYELVESASTIFQRREYLEKQLAALEEEEYKITSTLLSMTGGKSTYATYRMDDEHVVALKVKLPMKRASFDAEKLKNEHPDVYDKYIKQELDVTTLKAKEKKLAKGYIIPAKVNTEKAATLDSVTVKEIAIPSA